MPVRPPKPRMQATPEQIRQDNEAVKERIASEEERRLLEKKSQQLEKKGATRKTFEDSKNTPGAKLNSGYSYQATLGLIMADRTAETAYAFADVLGKDSAWVEKVGHNEVVDQAIEEGVNSRGMYAGSKGKLEDVGKDRMLRFARAMSCIAKEYAGEGEAYREGMDPLAYVSSGQRAKSDMVAIMGHVLDIADDTANKELTQKATQTINMSGLGQFFRERLVKP